MSSPCALQKGAPRAEPSCALPVPLGTRCGTGAARLGLGAACSHGTTGSHSSPRLSRFPRFLPFVFVFCSVGSVAGIQPCTTHLTASPAAWQGLTAHTHPAPRGAHGQINPCGAKKGVRRSQDPAGSALPISSWCWASPSPAGTGDSAVPIALEQWHRGEGLQPLLPLSQWRGAASLLSESWEKNKKKKQKTNPMSNLMPHLPAASG